MSHKRFPNTLAPQAAAIVLLIAPLAQYHCRIIARGRALHSAWDQRIHCASPVEQAGLPNRAGQTLQGSGNGTAENYH